jgi:NAD(P)H dehydrogenase (quinone)
MYAITGITGKVGGAVARTLVSAGQRGRAVVRDADKGRSWSERGCDVAMAEMEDAELLTRAFTDVTGVFILPPPNFDPEPGFPRPRLSSPRCAKHSMRRVRPRSSVSRPSVLRPRSQIC